VTLIYGNLYKIEKKRITIGAVGKLKASVSVAEDALITSGKKNPEEETKGGDYHVARLD